MKPTVQISLDLHDIDDALRVAEIAVEAGVDWIEAGTGLMVEQGLAATRALRKRFPDHPIVCDFKVADGGAYFARLAADSGATHFDVLAHAHDATIRGAVEIAGERGLTVLADTMISNQPVAQAIRAEKLGVHMICWHLGYDHRAAHPSLRAIDGLDEIIGAVKLPVQVVGGLSVEDAVEAVGCEHSVVGL